MYRIPDKKSFNEWMNDLIVLHDKLKNHPFREKFTDTFNTGTFKSLYKEYTDLIYETTEVISSMGYYCNTDSPISKEDTFWIHDFRSAMFTFNNIFYYDKKWMYNEDRHDNLGCSPYDFYKKFGLTDINNIMLFFERYIQYIHQFIESREFEKIAAIYYETYVPGWYIKHMTDYIKVDGKWVCPEFEGK